MVYAFVLCFCPLAMFSLLFVLLLYSLALIGLADDLQLSSSRVDSTKINLTTNLRNKEKTDLVDYKLLNSNQVDPNSLFQILSENVSECLHYNVSKIHPTAGRNAQFFIIHIKIRSLHKHHDDLVNFLPLCRSPTNILCITETRLQAKLLENVGLPG